MTRAEPLFVFDGDCAFCTTWTNRLRAALPRFPVAQPWQWTDLDAVGLSLDDVAHYAWVLAADRRYRGHAAFAALLRMQPGLGLRFVGHLLVTPPFAWAAAAGYAVIARFRHRLPGGTPACALEQSG